MRNQVIQSRQATWVQVLAILLLAVVTLAACGGGEESGDTPGGDGEAASAAADGPIRFIYLYTEDCAPCAGMEPVVDALAKEYADRVVVERHDATSEEGARLMSEYGLSSNPSYIILAADGTKLWSNTGQMHRDMLRQQLTSFLSK